MIIRYNNQDVEMNDKYSGKSHSYHKLSLKKEIDLKPGTAIYGSVFYQEWVEGDAGIIKDIFPTGMTGVTFYNCNLVNVYVPPGNTIIGGSNKAIKVQNDWEDWVLDASLNPIEPMDKKRRLRIGISIDPKDIPNTKLTIEGRKQFEDLIKQKETDFDNLESK